MALSYLKCLQFQPKISDENWHDFDHSWKGFEELAQTCLEKSATSMEEIRTTLHMTLPNTLLKRWREIPADQKAKATTIAKIRELLEPFVEEKPDSSVPFGSFTQRVQGPTEKVRSYYNALYEDLRKATNDARANTSLLHPKFTQGLRPELKMEAMKASNMQEALKNCERLENALGTGNAKPNDVVIGQILEGPMIAMINRQMDTIEKLAIDKSKEERPKTPREIKTDNRMTCYSCGKPGHRAKECRSRPPTRYRKYDNGNASKRQSDCYNCGETGHIARNCPNIRKSPNPSYRRKVSFDKPKIRYIPLVESDIESSDHSDWGNEFGTSD